AAERSEHRARADKELCKEYRGGAEAGRRMEDGNDDDDGSGPGIYDDVPVVVHRRGAAHSERGTRERKEEVGRIPDGEGSRVRKSDADAGGNDNGGKRRDAEKEADNGRRRVPTRAGERVEGK